MASPANRKFNKARRPDLAPRWITPAGCDVADTVTLISKYSESAPAAISALIGISWQLNSRHRASEIYGAGTTKVQDCEHDHVCSGNEKRGISSPERMW